MILDADQGRDAELRRARRAARPRRRVGRATSSAAARRPSAGSRRLGLDRARGRRGPAVGAADCTSTATRTGCSPRCCSRPPARRRGATRWRRSRGLCRRGARRGARPTSWASARNRRHRPGRGFEALRYRFEIVSDYGAFRDLQRHRMLTVQWQALTPGPRRRASRTRSPPPAAATSTRGALERSRAEYERLVAAGPGGRRAVRALPRLPHPLRARPQRARGDAPDRAALRPRGPPELPRGRARDARADRRPPPRGRRGDGATSTRASEPRLERILAEMRRRDRRAALRA